MTTRIINDFQLEDLVIIDDLGSAEMILTNPSGEYHYQITKTPDGYHVIYKLNKLTPMMMDTIDEIFAYAQAHETRALVIKK
ncbi:MAG TPA: hypothetical protein PLZ08_07200 [Bacillota bacterium]|jgi:hypothetical protein|nr:hypothetical protein [Bacillota bacterium]HOL09982.1 hypothetical protein [Bacillota bacterium]HPO97731.1 hypothetical protein [Bacillota bacterium]